MPGNMFNYGSGKSLRPWMRNLETPPEQQGAVEPTMFIHYAGEARQPDGSWVPELTYDPAEGKELEPWTGNQDELPPQTLASEMVSNGNYLSMIGETAEENRGSLTGTTHEVTSDAGPYAAYLSLWETRGILPPGQSEM
jgi:hypothetical protein